MRFPFFLTLISSSFSLLNVVLFFFPLGRDCSMLFCSQEDLLVARAVCPSAFRGRTGPRRIPKANCSSSSSRIFKDFKKYQQQTESYSGSTTSLWSEVINILSLFLKKRKLTSSKLSKKENLQIVFFSKSWLISLSSMLTLGFQDHKWNANSLSLTYIKKSDNYI